MLDILTLSSQDHTTLNDVFLVMEHEEIDIRMFMQTGSNLDFGSEHIKIVLYNMLCAMNYLSSANIVHRDIKPANILLNKHCQVKICDFGLARTLPESLNGKGSGNTKRVRDSILRHQVDDELLKGQIRAKLEK